jgi:hypothetical protein
MRKTISNAVGGLIKNLTDLGPDAVADIDGNFEICLGNKNVISLREIMHTYQRGAAHPDNYSTSFNFQMNPPAVLTLKSIFGSGSGYLKTLSRICADQLLQDAKGGYVDKEQVRRACAPVTDNFRNFVIQEKSLQIDFSEDQIGSHAEGAPTISIPYSKIKSRLNPSSVVYKLATSAQ